MADLSTKEKYALKKTVKELATYRGRHTELVTVYISAGYDINKVITQIEDEQGTATNIKSTSTRKNVTDALERMLQKLKLYRQTPPNGLALFSGNVAEREGQSDVKVWAIEPPVPLKVRIYRCDKTFVVEPLEDMMEVKEVYGLVVLDRRDAMLALLKGKTIIPLQKTHSEVPGKTRAGGQSSVRFARLREGATIEHFKKIADYMKDQFLGMENLQGIIIGGPGVTVNDFINKEYLTGELKKKIIGVKDLSYTDDFGMQELLDKSQDILAAEEVVEEKKLMLQFFEYLAKKPGMVSYGEKEVMEKLTLGAVDTLLISENLDDSLIEKFEEKASEMGTNLKIISVETREGVQLKDMGGIAALLRYESSY